MLGGALSQRLNRPALAGQVRGMAVICFASAALMVFTTLFPYREVDEARRLVAIALTAGAGLAYWWLAPWFRVWMLHSIVSIGFAWGCLGLAQANDPIGAALVLSTLLWTCVYVGACFEPPVARVYGVLVWAGLGGAIAISGIGGGTAIAVAFGASFLVTMEILSRATSRLRHEATTDHLTGLLNRKGLEREIERVGAIADQGRRSAVLVADLDGFKQLNDRDGHLAGDRALVELAAAWRSELRAGDVLARVGGDEFVVIFADAGAAAAEAAVERLRAISPVPWSGGLVISEPGESVEACLERADRRLYEEKLAKPEQEGGGDGNRLVRR